MITCMYCEAESDDEENNFCEKCFNPIKCINCRSLLKINTPICLKCGTSITLPNYNSTNTSNISPAVNKFILEEHQTNSSAYRRIEGEFTDEAIDKAAMMLGAGRISMKSNQVSNIIQQKSLPIKQNNINNTIGNSDDDIIEEKIISQEEDFFGK